MVDASGDQFVAYFLPTTDTIRKRKRDQEGEKEYTEEEEWVQGLTSKISLQYHYIAKPTGDESKEHRLGAIAFMYLQILGTTSKKCCGNHKGEFRFASWDSCQ